MLKTLSGRNASQNEFELMSFIALLVVDNARSYFEIGARHGDTFYEIMRSLPVGSKGVAVDLPGGLWGKRTSKSSLIVACDKLKEMGYDITCIFGDSNNDEVLDKVKAAGPYDAALIDGDHLYNGVKSDWERYGKLAKIVAFHDIVGEGQVEKVTNRQVEVPRLWAEIKKDSTSGYSTTEFVDRSSAMGIGCVRWAAK